MQHIVGVERDDFAAGRDEVDAGTLNAGEAEIEAIEKRDDGHPKDLVVAKRSRQLDLPRLLCFIGGL